jgi:hypothetical protein
MCDIVGGRSFYVGVCILGAGWHRILNSHISDGGCKERLRKISFTVTRESIRAELGSRKP